MPAEVREYKGHPVMALVYKDKNGVERRFSFGVRKAQLIVENLADIQAFVQTQGGDGVGTPA